MKAFDALESQNLRWVSASNWKMNFELRDADEAVAAMRRVGWSSTAEVDAVGNRWRFQPKGFWQRYTSIQSIGTGEEVAQFRNMGWSGGGRLEFADGRVYHWKPSNWWGSKWAWTTEDGEPIVGFVKGGVFRLNGEVRLHADLKTFKVPPVLVFFGWYLVTVYYEQASTVAAVT